MRVPRLQRGAGVGIDLHADADLDDAGRFPGHVILHGATNQGIKGLRPGEVKGRAPRRGKLFTLWKWSAPAGSRRQSGGGSTAQREGKRFPLLKPPVCSLGGRNRHFASGGAGMSVVKDRVVRPGRSMDAGRGGVQSLARALSILRALAQSYEGLTLTELSDTVALPPSTAHRLLTTLQRDRFVRFDQASMLWQVGVQAFEVGNAFARSRDVVAIARPYMRRLMEESGETVNLYVLNEDEAVCMAQIESRQMMRAISRPGGRVALHMSGAGKAMMACMLDEDVDRIAADKGLRQATPKTLGTLKALKTELRRIRALGYAVDDEEFALGLRCVAAPIMHEHGCPYAALSLSGPTVRVSDKRLPALGALVMQAAASTAAELGGRSTFR